MNPQVGDEFRRRLAFSSFPANEETITVEIVCDAYEKQVLLGPLRKISKS